MKRLAIWVLVLAALLAMGCSGGGSDTCATTTDCVTGYACNQDGTCVPADPLRIVTETLPDATLGIDYDLTLVASGGIPDYTWSLESGPGWLELGVDSGTLSGIPDQAGVDLEVLVSVTDSSLGGQTVSGQLLLTGTACVSGRSQVCHEAEGNACMEGSQTCSDSQWGPCEDKTHSTAVEHCGSDCAACDPAKADGCDLGVCACGTGAVCTGLDICCGGLCVDAQGDSAHCGACGVNCSVLTVHAENPRCFEGACIYTTCDPGFLDCNGIASDGCETPRAVEHCEGCGLDCTAQVQNATDITCEQDAAGFHCAYGLCELGFLDCDGQISNGCEIPTSDSECEACGQACGADQDQRCVLDPSGDFYRCGCLDETDCAAGQQCCAGACYDLDDPGHCGDCDTDCTLAGDTPLCIDSPNHVCGCAQDQDCGEGHLCCNNACVLDDIHNCGACGADCLLSATNRACVYDDTLPGNRCGCEDDVACDLGQQCCPAGLGYCLPLDDPENCGSCSASCLGNSDGQACIDPVAGTCGCIDSLDCLSGGLCCNGVCTPVNDANCGSCGFACNAERGGAFCDLQSEQCYCQADEECLDFVGSGHTCDGIGVNARCGCGGSTFCPSFEFFDQDCCETVPGTFECVILSQDNEHCGRCGVQCSGAPAPDCFDGECGCAPGMPPIECPVDSPATDCQGNYCKCPAGPGGDGCDLGRYCCDGTQAGQGGPGGSADLGCCDQACGSNLAGECDYT